MFLCPFSLGYRGNISCKTVLQLDKFAPYEATEKDLIERRFQDITNDYDKSPPPTASTTPTHYPTLNSIIFENGNSSLSDLNGNTTKTDALCAGMQRGPGAGLAGTGASSGGHLISNLTAAHNMSAVGSFPIDAKMLQFSTDQVTIELFLLQLRVYSSLSRADSVHVRGTAAEGRHREAYQLPVQPATQRILQDKRECAACPRHGCLQSWAIP